MNKYRCLIEKLTLYEFEVGYISIEITKNICRANVEGEVDHSTVNRYLIGWLFRFDAVSTLFGPLNAELNFKQFSLV